MGKDVRYSVQLSFHSTDGNTGAQQVKWLSQNHTATWWPADRTLESYTICKKIDGSHEGARWFSIVSGGYRAPLHTFVHSHQEGSKAQGRSVPPPTSLLAKAEQSPLEDTRNSGLASEHSKQIDWLALLRGVFEFSSLVWAYLHVRHRTELRIESHILCPNPPTPFLFTAPGD